MKSSVQYCQQYESRHPLGVLYFTHFMPDPHVTRLYDDEKPVFKALVEECEEAPDCYWSWWEEKDQEFQFTAYWKGAVEMCFPYGTKVEEDRGNGRLLPVKVTILEENVGC